MNRNAGVLSDAEWAFGYAVGAARCDWNRNRGHRDDLPGYYNPAGDRLAGHVVGAFGELACAERWALKWRPLWLTLDPARPDVGNLHVRATELADGCLPIRPRDLALVPDEPFVLVIVDGRRWRIAGWLYARDAHKGHSRRVNGLAPARFVPQPELLPVWTCPAHDVDEVTIEVEVEA